MTDAKIAENAVKTMDHIHRLLIGWLLLCLLYSFVPRQSDHASISLPFTSLQVPNDVLKWGCFVAILCVGFVGSALFTHLQRICAKLSTPDALQTVLTYPSIATLGTPRSRWLCFFAASFIQFSVGFDFVVGIVGAPSHWGGLSWFYIGPFLWFGATASRWQESLEANEGTVMGVSTVEGREKPADGKQSADAV